MASDYHDRWIACTPDGLRIRAYYIPWGTKTIPYRSIRAIRRVPLGLLTGRARLWGTANPRYWASLDPRRPVKRYALILDVGAPVQPFITPDDPRAVEAIIRERAGLPAPGAHEGAVRRGPLI